MVKEKISIFPAEDVGVGADPPAQRIVFDEPPIWNNVGIYPVDPCVTRTLIVIIFDASVGTFVTLNVIFPVGAVAI
jgi:hypothetical protein